MQKIIKLNLYILLLLAFCFQVFAQTQKQLGKVEDFKLSSRLMSREMPYRVIFPVNYDHKDTGNRYPVIYLLHGLTGHFDNWADKTKLKEYAGNYQYIIVMPEGNDGWYSDSATVANDKYESYIIQELIPEIDLKFQTKMQKESRVIAGLSMGGYGSLKFGLKYPDKFILVGSFSGALMAPSLTAKMLGTGWKALTDSIVSVYGEDDSQTRKDNDIFKILREMPPEKAKELPFIYLDCGTEDGLIQTNREFTDILFQKKIPHEFRQLPGKHDWKFWDSQIYEFLELSKKHIK